MFHSVTKIATSVLLSCIAMSALAKEPPKITELEPPAGPVGTVVKINGLNFSGEPLDNKVRLGRKILKISSAYPNQLSVKIPKGASTGKITVDVKNAGRTSSPKDFVVMSPLNVKSISASYGAPGSKVTIQGAGFSTIAKDNTVKVGGEKCIVIKATATQLDIKLPNKSVMGRFSIDVKHNGRIENRNNFVVAHQPVIRTFKPSSGLPGSEVTVLGMHFGSDKGKVQVRLGGKPANIVSVKDKKIVIQVPKGAPSGPIQLAVNKLKSEPSSKTFEVMEGLTATKMDPLKVFRGQEVKIFGRGFAKRAADHTLSIGKVKVKATRLEQGAVVFTVPTNAPTGKNKVVFVAKKRGSIDVPVPLTVLEPAAVTGFTPTNGAPGTLVTIQGKSFGNSSNNVRVIIGGKYAHVRNVTPSSIMANIPKGAASGAPITVQTRYYGTAVSKQKLTVATPVRVAITSFSPTTGAPNQTVQINGSGFSSQANQNKVYLGRAPCRVLRASPTALQVQLPQQVATDRFKIWVGKSGYAEAPRPFTVAAPRPAAPARQAMTITSITPTTGKIGTYVTVNGSGFTSSGMRAYVGRVPVGLRVYTQNRAMIAIPNNAIGGPVTFVSSSGAQARSKDVFKLVSPVSVNKFYPDRGRPGDKVTIYGSDFKPGATRVFLGNQQLKTEPGMNQTMVVVTIPNGAASGPFRVAVAGKTDAKSVRPFKVLPPITSKPITTAKPKAEPLFTSTKDDTPVIETLMKEEPKAPPKAKENKKAPSIDELLGFESDGETIQLTSIDPTKGPVGETITINGSGFGDNPAKVSAWVGSAKAKVLGTVPDMIMIEVPSGAKSGKVKIRIGGKPPLTSKGEFKVIK